MAGLGEVLVLPKAAECGFETKPGENKPGGISVAVWAADAGTGVPFSVFFPTFLTTCTEWAAPGARSWKGIKANGSGITSGSFPGFLFFLEVLKREKKEPQCLPCCGSPGTWQLPREWGDR